MQKGHVLEFGCQSCQSPIPFSILELEKKGGEIPCPHCSIVYVFSDEDLKRQIRKFEGLCRQIHQSEEILSNTSVGIFLGDREIKIPFKLLLTRLNSTLDLILGNKPLKITFRIEPTKDISKTLAK